MTDLRIAFTGSCQVAGLSAAAARLLPGASIEAYHVGAGPEAAQVADRVAGFDIVVTQIREGDGPSQALSPVALSPRVGRVVPLPIFVFTGLHPDTVFIPGGDGNLPGVYARMHSLLAAASYLAGCDVARARRLFNSHVFAELGYFDAFEAASRALVRLYGEAGYDIAGMPERMLARHGAFMHTVNHPAIAVLAELAVHALVRAGAVASGTAAPPDVQDSLRLNVVAPVYPPIARRLGLEGGFTFLSPAEDGRGREIDFDDYLTRAFAVCHAIPRAILERGRVAQAADILTRLMR